jgi:hypothetical protein
MFRLATRVRAYFQLTSTPEKLWISSVATIPVSHSSSTWLIRPADPKLHTGHSSLTYLIYSNTSVTLLLPGVSGQLTQSYTLDTLHLPILSIVTQVSLFFYLAYQAS